MGKLIAWRACMTTAAAALLISGCGPAATTPAGGAGATAAPGAAGAAGATPAPTPVAFPASAPPTTTFTEPTQNAFTISVPQGWTVNGGVAQPNPSTALPWVTAASPDGATTITINDPTIPSYVSPNAQHPQGSAVQLIPGDNSYAEPYQTGAQYAQYYASTIYGPTCSPLQVTGTQGENAAVQLVQASANQMALAVGVAPPPTQYDGGSATFSCQMNGAPMAVGVIDVTALAPSDGFWTVGLLVAYRTPAASQAQTDQIARAMRSSFKPNAQWQAQQAAAAKTLLATLQKNDTTEEGELAADQAAEANALRAQAQAFQQQSAARR